MGAERSILVELQKTDQEEHRFLTSDEALIQEKKLKVLANFARLQIISILLNQPETLKTEEDFRVAICVDDLTDNIKLTQPTISHHISILLKHGFATSPDKSGLYSYYHVNRDEIRDVAEFLFRLIQEISPTDAALLLLSLLKEETLPDLVAFLVKNVKKNLLRQLVDSLIDQL
jgi:ArsR family transcriptional regulator, arsenate/arsenite/antimonite-responsive transcriptional repressor